MNAHRAVLIALCAAALVPGTPARAQRETRERHVFVGVTDAKGAPVTGLGPQDFVVREDDRVREVTRVSAAPPPSHLALLVDNSETSNTIIADIRDSLGRFVQGWAAIDAPPAIGVMTFGERPTMEADFTTSLPAQARAVLGVFPRMNSGAYLLEAIIDASKRLQKAKAERPVIVALVLDASTEFSDVHRDRVAAALKEAGASLWTVELEDRRQSLSDDMQERQRVVSEVTVASGGMNKPILSRLNIDAAFAAITSAMTSRYDVVYTRPDALIPPSKLAVEAKNRALRVAAPRWTRE